ncbi:hypothetical protein EON64_21295 [archaeon]|nr:MAG: hypothetical protein EON64_21295 [archaeon]
MALSKVASIKIPLVNDQSCVEIFPDELPVDVNDIIDVLRSELAPLRVWRNCAVEYYRKGDLLGFDAILSDILEALQSQEELESMFKGSADYVESVTELYLAMAARELLKLSELKNSVHVDTEQVSAVHKKVVDYMKLAEEKMRLHEYYWVLRGFFEIVNGILACPYVLPRIIPYVYVYITILSS